MFKEPQEIKQRMLINKMNLIHNLNKKLNSEER
jgi:hypothetical protein